MGKWPTKWLTRFFFLPQTAGAITLKTRQKRLKRGVKNEKEKKAAKDAKCSDAAQKVSHLKVKRITTTQQKKQTC